MTKLYSQLRTEDEYLSNHVSEILDNTFYTDPLFNISDFKRIYDKPTQIKGIDTIFTYNNYTYKCDEKSAVRYKNLKTFALELSFKNRNDQLYIGWFLNDNLDTNSYLLTWLNEENNGEKEIELALVKKNSIYDYLKNELKWTKELLKKKNDRIRNNEDNSLGNIYTNGCKFSFSKQLVEQPVNILLPKSAYIKIADIHKKYKL